MKYDYMESMVEDILNHIEYDEDLTEWDDREEFEDHLNEVLWDCDSVTGNASGSYTFNTWKAEENLSHNWDLLAEALNEFCEGDAHVIDKGPEWCDVTIRCYLLGSAIAEALDRLNYDFDANHTDEDEEAEEEAI